MLMCACECERDRWAGRIIARDTFMERERPRYHTELCSRVLGRQEYGALSAQCFLLKWEQHGVGYQPPLGAPPT